MSDIETLRQQLKDAKAATSAAQEAERAALRAVKDALLDATGFRGHIVEGFEYSIGGKRAAILVRGMGRYGDNRLQGDVIKKDGTPGERTKEIMIEGAVSLGLYEGRA